MREAIGKDGERCDPPDSVTTIEDLIDWLAAKGDGYALAFADRDRLRAALDQRFVPLDTELGGAKELALFPPVTGG